MIQTHALTTMAPTLAATPTSSTPLPTTPPSLCSRKPGSIKIKLNKACSALTRLNFFFILFSTRLRNVPVFTIALYFSCALTFTPKIKNIFSMENFLDSISTPTKLNCVLVVEVNFSIWQTTTKEKPAYITITKQTSEDLISKFTVTNCVQNQSVKTSYVPTPIIK